MITFFKVFEYTRYLSGISIKVLIELVPFLIVLFGQNLVFAVIFKAMEFVGEAFVEGKQEENGEDPPYKDFTNLI
jgi:hypothetical protein